MTLFRIALLFIVFAHPLTAQTIVKARFTDPTTRYPHGVLGDRVEFGGLEMTLSDGQVAKITLPNTRVFEDLAPRVVDLDHDGAPEVIVVEADASEGAQLAIYGASGKIIGTPFIGTRFRWLAPIAAADLDGDGLTELAYIETPHLGKTLVIWRYNAGNLEFVGRAPGLTNHRIGEDFITSALRTCPDDIGLITADARWQKVMISRLRGGVISMEEIGAFTGPASITGAASCP
ncbi:MAG: VCBS repeat-containing protein [Pseudomonadota bacterium]